MKKEIITDKNLSKLLESIKNKRILKPKDILRLHSKLIASFIDGSIKSEFAKTLSYLCQNQLILYRAIEFEKRLENLESRFMV